MAPSPGSEALQRRHVRRLARVPLVAVPASLELPHAASTSAATAPTAAYVVRRLVAI